VISLRASDGNQLWSFAAGNALSGGGIAVDSAKGLVFALCVLDSAHSGLCALNAKTGALLWSWAIYTDGGNPVGSSPYNPPVISDGMVFLGESDTVDFSHVGYFVALNESDGSLVWQRGNCGDTGHNYCNFMGSNPAAVANGLVIYDTGFEQSPYAAVCAVGETDGALAWCFPAAAINQTSHAPSVANNLVFLSETDSNNSIDFFALNATTGTVAWSNTVSNNNGGSGARHGVFRLRRVPHRFCLRRKARRRPTLADVYARRFGRINRKRAHLWLERQRPLRARRRDRQSALELCHAAAQRHALRGQRRALCNLQHH
jgi:outer membrane protein assembly factor BamB